MRRQTAGAQKRDRRMLVVAAGALLVSVVHLPAAVAETSCARSESSGYSTLTVNIGTAQTVAVRFSNSGVDVADDVNEAATDFVPQQEGIDAECMAQGEIERLLINGADGDETLKVIEWGTAGGETPGSDVQTTVDLGSGNDMLEFMSADTNNNGVTDVTPSMYLSLGMAAGGTGIVADQGPTVEGNHRTDCVESFVGNANQSNGLPFDCTDLWAKNVENVTITGGTRKGGDVIDAQGDFDDGFVDADLVSLLEDNDPRLPGTADHEGLNADGGTDRDDNEPNGGNLDVNLTINLFEGRDLVAPGDAADTIDGGPGKDFLDYAEAGGAVEVDLGSGKASGASGNDSVINFEGISGSVFDDMLLGSGRSNFLAGNCGDDVIRTRGKRDLATGDAGFLFGVFVCDEPAGSEDDPGDALPTFSSGNDRLSGQAGGDSLNGGPASDSGNGGAGRDRCRKIEREKSCER
jgi:hypothetical protein